MSKENTFGQEGLDLVDSYWASHFSESDFSSNVGPFGSRCLHMAKCQLNSASFDMDMARNRRDLA